jgi:hypothetical protein
MDNFLHLLLQNCREYSSKNLDRKCVLEWENYVLKFKYRKTPGKININIIQQIIFRKSKVQIFYIWNVSQHFLIYYIWLQSPSNGFKPRANEIHLIILEAINYVH